MSACHDARTEARTSGGVDAAARIRNVRVDRGDPGRPGEPTSLGPYEAWPHALRAMIDVCLAARLPMAVFWGEDGLAFYNDACLALLEAAQRTPEGSSSPACAEQGVPARATLDADVDAARAVVLATGEPRTLEDRRLTRVPLPRPRFDAPHEARHFDVTLTPFGRDAGSAGGVVCAAVEITRRVVGERRLRVLQEIADAAGRAATPREACASVSRTLASDHAAVDVSFSRLYVFEAGASRGKLAAASGVATVPCGEEVILDASTSAAGARSALAEAARTGRAQVLGDGRALAVPLRDGEQTFALLVLGTGRDHELDAEERSFFDLVAAQVGMALRNAGTLATPAPPPHDAGTDARAAVVAARRQVEEAHRVKDEFLATVSHELRTPLTSILGWARLLKSRPVDAATLAKGLATIERNARAEAQLIEDVLDVSRLATGAFHLARARFDLPSAVENAVALLRPVAATRHVSLEVEVDDDARTLVGDAARVQQVVWHLLSNAVKFTPRGGHVELHAERDGDDVVLAVTDDGEGIPTEFLPHVFERFRQADASTTRAHAGLGLGLSMVRHIVELHGGSVAVASGGKGLGARFEVRLPAPHEASDAATSAPASVSSRAARISSSPPSGDALRGLRILVVDDEPDAREFLTMILSDRGADPRGAATVREALEAIGPFHPDVLVSDIGMPDEDGYDLIRRIRAEGGEMRGVPALAVTAYAGAEDRRRAIGAGYQMYLAKPFEPDELIGAISHLAGRAPPPLHS